MVDDIDDANNTLSLLVEDLEDDVLGTEGNTVLDEDDVIADDESDAVDAAAAAAAEVDDALIVEVCAVVRCLGAVDAEDDRVPYSYSDEE